MNIPIGKDIKRLSINIDAWSYIDIITIIKNLFIVLPVLIAFVFFAAESNAQTGTVTGPVSDAQTGKSIPGAEVFLESIGQSVNTDMEGRFSLNRIPGGSQKAIIQFPGYSINKVNFLVDSGKLLVKNMELTGELIEDDRRNSKVHTYNSAAKLSSRQDSLQIKTVINSDQINRFTDLSVSQATARLSGVQRNSRGELNIRGVGQNKYNVTFNGMRMPGTGLGDRSYDLGILSADMVHELEVIKVVTPDMNADGLGGIVNIIQRQPAGDERLLNASVGGLVNSDYLNQTGLGSRASFAYSESPREDFSITFNLNHQRVPHGWQSIGIDYDVLDFGSEPMDVLRTLSPGLNYEEQNRIGGGVQFTFQPSSHSSYYLGSTVINNSHIHDKHEHRWLTGDEWIDPSTPAEGVGVYQYNLQSRDSRNLQYAIHAGARHHLPFLSLDYNLGWGYSKTNLVQYNFPFEVSRLDLSVEAGNRMRPEIINMGVLPGVSNTRLQIMNRVLNDQIENLYTGRLNIEIPFAIGSIKVGSSVNMTNITGDFRDGDFQNLRALHISNFDLSRNGPYDIMEPYYFPWTLDSEKARSFFETGVHSFRVNNELQRKRSDIWNHKALENTYAGYGMAILEFGKFVLVGGARMEFTDAVYDGRKSMFNARGRYRTTADTSQSVTYSHLYPNAQLAYSPTNSAKIRLAYTKTMARHSYDKLAPFELITSQDSTLFRGNPHLSPIISNNIDFLFDYSSTYLGLFGIALFYKELSGFLYQREKSLEIQEGEIDGFEELFDAENSIVAINDRQYQNSEETATVYGLELSWQQNLDFLPGFLGNFTTYANYTWSHSIFNSHDRDSRVALPKQSPHVLNVALRFTQNRFSGQASYHWTAPSIQKLQPEISMAPAIDPVQSVYMDLYQDGWRDVSVSMRYRVTNNIRVWIDIDNLLNVERIMYEHTRDRYPRVVDLNTGLGISAGIRYDL